MKKASFFRMLPVILTGVCLLAFQFKKTTDGAGPRKKDAVTCGSLADDYHIDTAANGKFIVRLPGWGHYSYPISTKQDSAQFYFDQGLTMYYSYHMKEALASFKEASRFDPSAPMPYWGQALTMGPYYNAANSYVVPGGLKQVLKLLNAAAGNTGEKEKALVKAMNLRYPVVNGLVAHNGVAYAQDLRKLISAYPNDQDIKMLYIDAMMLMHAWDFWTTAGTAKEWTPELVTLCKGVLKTNPDHPAALHYFIHLTEASNSPDVALANAEALKRLFPGVSHMVHMSSHVYQRNGLYFQGVDANEKARKNVLLYSSIAGNIGIAKSIPHLFAVQTYCAFSGGMYEKAMEAALTCKNSVKSAMDDNYAQYLYMMPEFTMVRLGKWNDILKNKNALNPRWTYAGIINNFARGLAFLYSGRLDSADAELVSLRKKMDELALKIRRIPFNTPLEGATIAENILAGGILLARNKYEDGIACLNKAVEVEDGMIYAEPAEWPMPARQFLGAYLLKNDNYTLAEQVYRDDLVHNPGSGWSLLGLYQSVKAQNHTANLAEYKSGFLRSFSHADVVPTGSVFLN